MGTSETIEVTGHLMDSGILSRVLDDIRDYGGDFAIESFDVGRDNADPSRALISVRADDHESLQRLLMRLQARVVNLVTPGEVRLLEAPADGVLPDGFYATSNLSTRVHVLGRWHEVENPEMDCCLAVLTAPDGVTRVRTVPMCEVRRGTPIVVGAAGIVVVPPDPESMGPALGASEVGGDRPHSVLVRQVADGVRRTHESGQKVLWVVGPGVVHTGASSALVSLVEAGFVDVLFAGNAFATHDVEAALYGSSLGGDLSLGQAVENGREHSLRAINTIRAAGSIKEAVETGVLKSGVMHALARHDCSYVLVGSVRDDGPLPDVVTDVVAGQRAMRAQVEGVGYCLMMAALTHSEATGNILPASVPVVCVDINPTTVTMLTDRGSTRSLGIVTDVGLFLEQLAHELVSGRRGI